MNLVLQGPLAQGMIAACEWKNRHLSIKAGWPYRSYDGAGMSPEVRSLAGADLDDDGTIEIIAANTQTDQGEPQVYVLSPNGTLYQPPGIAWQAWPRYHAATGTGNDADANGAGNHGYGCYGLNLGVGDLDDDPALEIVVTFDNHQINVFDHDGVSKLASDYYRNRATEYYDRRLNWGQMMRWFDPAVEAQHYHEHQGSWPSPADTPWCQWTTSPCNVVDLNGDGTLEIVVQTFDGNCFVYSVPGSATNSMSWPTARGSYLRQGRTMPSKVEFVPRMLGITITGDGVTIDWKSAPRTRQSLECSDDPGAAASGWTVLRTYEPPTGVTNRFVDTPLSTARYYRVRAE